MRMNRKLEGRICKSIKPDSAEFCWTISPLMPTRSCEFDISLSAVYRNLSALESEGKVRRVSKSGSREVYYQYTDCMSCKDCLHLSCEKCGKTYHMNIPGMEMLIENLASSDEFAIDRKNTVLYGVCKSCQKEEKEKVS